MPFVDVPSLDASEIQEFNEPGDELVGYYHGFKTIQGKRGESKLHIVQRKEDGTNIGVWGKAMLDSALSHSSIRPQNGEAVLVQIVYGGLKQLSNGNTRHEFRVRYDVTDKTTAAASFEDEAALEQEQPLTKEPAVTKVVSPLKTKTSKAVSLDQFEDEQEYADDMEEAVLPPSRPTSSPASVSTGNVSKASALLNRRK